MQINFSTSVEEEVVKEVKEEIKRQQQIVLYNDDLHTFDFVIEALVELCKHNLVQAEQCTYLVHFKGKCAVKNGSYEKLKPICSALLNRGLTAEIE